MSISFSDLGVADALVRRLEARGILEPFPIQVASLPDALSRRDVVGKAPTGSGKTLAFGLALVANTGKAAPRRPKGLVLVPTRELAAQVQKELAQLTSDRGRRVLCIYGGTSYNVARKALAAGVDIVVACPGRLEDMLEQRALDLADVTTVVVDEADRMADMGFLPAVRRIISTTSSERHVMLFSATMGPDVQSLVREFTHDAAVHDVVGDEAPSDVDHFFWRVPREQRSSFTAQIIETHGSAIVFTRTKHGADRLARQLEERGISAVPLHGDRTQAQRERALKSVKNGTVQVLVATDVAARGIHIDELPCVVHFDPPAQANDYLHRSGRTGRAGAQGVVISLVGEDVVGQVKRLQKALGITDGIDTPDNALAIRLGRVDDVDAAVRLDDRPTGKSSRPQSRENDRRPSSSRFERPERPRGARSEFAPRREFNDSPRREPRRENSSAPRREFNSDGPRREFNDSPRREFNSDGPRREPRREFGDAARRNDRPERSTRPSTRPAERSYDRSNERRGNSNSEAVVSFFNDSKGYGFAIDDKGQDLFIHFSNIEGEGFKSLAAGQRVTYEAATGPKGLEARNVRVVSGRRRS